jgi:hypothetical protein
MDFAAFAGVCIVSIPIDINIFEIDGVRGENYANRN